MAHKEQRVFIKAVADTFPDFFSGKKVLEIGSLNINGTIRDFFKHSDYTGIDVGPGKDVDQVCPGQHYGGQAGQFDVVISCEAMEHNPDYATTFLNMVRMLKPDGILVLTCASVGRRQHGTVEFLPQDSPLTHAIGQNYYKNLTVDDFKNLINFDYWFSKYHSETDFKAYDLYLFALGKHATLDAQNKAAKLATVMQQYYYKKNVLGVY